MKDRIPPPAPLTKLGSKKTEYKFDDPSSTMLEVFEAPDGEVNIKFETVEFSSLCPKTGQPDFAIITINYTPDKWCVETKSLKLYLFAFRNYQSFMEKIIRKITDDLVTICDPKNIKVTGEFTTRGGIASTVTANYVKPFTLS